MGLSITARAADLLHGAVSTVAEGEGWFRPVRFTQGQLRALGSVRAWHPGYYRQLAACTAGVTLEFDTDATSVSIEVRMGEVPRGTASVIADVERHATMAAGNKDNKAEKDEKDEKAAAAPLYDGLSANVDGRHVPLCLPNDDDLLTISLDDPDAAPEPGLVRLPIPGMGEPHRVRVWLPCLAPCAVREVRCDGTYLTPVPERGQLLVLGDSIAQGYVSCDPARSWAALLADHMGLDLLNQGVGGQVFQPGSLAGLAEVARPEAIVVEFGENYRYEPCQAPRVDREIRAYLYEVSEAWPDVPTWALTPMPHLEDAYPTHPRSCADAVPAMIAEHASRHTQMRLVDGSALLDAGSLETLLADGSDHPGTDGHQMVADRLAFVVDATHESPQVRRERALLLADARGDAALPRAEPLREGRGEVLYADEGAVVLDLGDNARIVMGPSRRALRRALTSLGATTGVTMVCGGRSLAREAARAMDGHARRCHVVLWPRDAAAPATDASRDIRVLTPAYAGLIRECYEHAEYFSPGELERLLESGAFLGGFEEGRLVAFVGEHSEGCMGALEVLEGHRREGWATALVSAKVARLLEEGRLPWAEVWPENAASLALEKKMGFEVRSADEFWIVA